MQFQSFQPSKSGSISKTEDGKERIPSASRPKHWMQALSSVELALDSDTETSPHHGGFHYSTRTEKIVVAMSDLRKLRTVAFRELALESNFLTPEGLRMQSRSKTPDQSPAQWIFAPVVSSSGPTTHLAATVIGEQDVVWSSASAIDPLKRSLTMWQDSLFHSVDSLLAGKISEFFVLGTSASETEAMEGMFGPTCAFFRTDSSQFKVFLLNCGQYAVKRLQQLGAQCERMLDGNQPKVSAATSTAGVLQLLRGSNHIVVDGEHGVRTAAQFVVEEVFSFMEKGTPCKSIPPLLSCSELLYSQSDQGMWMIVSAARQSTENGSADRRLGGWLRSLLEARGRECISPTEPPADAEDARQLKAKLSSSVTIQQVAKWVEQWMEAGRRPPPSAPSSSLFGTSSTSASSATSTHECRSDTSTLFFYDEQAMRQVRRRLSLSHAVEKAPMAFGRSASHTIRAPEKTPLLKLSFSSTARILNPMVIVIGREASRSAEQPQQPLDVQHGKGDTAGEGKRSDERWFRLFCREFPGKVGSYLFAAHARVRGGTGVQRNTMDVVREIRWTSRSEDSLELVVDRMQLPSIVRAELWDAREKAKSGVDGEGALELAPLKPYSAHVESVW